MKRTPLELRKVDKSLICKQTTKVAKAFKG
jgi:hypothetical protein